MSSETESAIDGMYKIKHSNT